MTANKEELEKQQLDAIIYGNGFALMQEDGTVRHIDIRDVYLLPSGDDDEHTPNKPFSMAARVPSDNGRANSRRRSNILR